MLQVSITTTANATATATPDITPNATANKTANATAILQLYMQHQMQQLLHHCNTKCNTKCNNYYIHRCNIITYNFLWWDTFSGQEPSKFKFDEANHIEAGVDRGVVVVVSLDQPVVTLWGRSWEMNLCKKKKYSKNKNICHTSNKVARLKLIISYKVILFFNLFDFIYYDK